MLQVLDFTYSNVIATKAVGKLREEDMESVHSLIHRITDSGQKVRWYFEMEHFTGWDAEGLWEDLKVDPKHASDYERIAMVGDKKWQKWMTRLMKPFTAADIRYFDLSEREKARIWIRS